MWVGKVMSRQWRKCLNKYHKILGMNGMFQCLVNTVCNTRCDENWTVTTMLSVVRCAQWLPEDRASSWQTSGLSSRDSADSVAWSRLSDTALCSQWQQPNRSFWVSHFRTEAPPFPWGWRPCWAAWWPGPPPPWRWCWLSQISSHLCLEQDLKCKMMNNDIHLQTFQ